MRILCPQEVSIPVAIFQVCRPRFFLNRHKKLKTFRTFVTLSSQCVARGGGFGAAHMALRRRKTHTCSWQVALVAVEKVFRSYFERVRAHCVRILQFFTFDRSKKLPENFFIAASQANLLFVNSQILCKYLS